MITLKNLSRIYTRKQSVENVVALDGINLTLPEKGFISIVGASGSGKTTLLNIVGGLDKQTSGEMIVDGLSTSDFKEKDWDAYRNEKIGFVFQNCYLLPHLNVRDNVAITLQISSKKLKNLDEYIDKALAAVDLMDKKYDKPKALSGGQKQRVAIARAIVGEPTVILADEPTGALDSKNGKQIMELLKKLSKDHLIVVVTHNHEYAEQYSDRIIELSDGKIVSDSSPMEKENDYEVEPLKRVSLPVKTSLKWAFKNLIVKKFSTLAIILAASLGLAGVGLILSISKGVETAFVETEASSLSKYPVRIYSSAYYEYEGGADTYKKYTDEEVIYADLSNYSTREHLNYMSDNFLEYMDAMPNDYYYSRYTSSTTNFNMFTSRHVYNEEKGLDYTDYFDVSSASSYFYKGVDDLTFLKDTYDCIAGKYATEPNEVLLVVDTYNRMSAYDLNSIGFYVDTTKYSKTSISFNDILGKKYHIVGNNDFYYNDSTDPDVPLYKQVNKSDEEFFKGPGYDIEIVGILREKQTSDANLLHQGLMYSPLLLRTLKEQAEASDVLKDQRRFKETLNVFTGAPFKEIEASGMKYTIDYQLEAAIYKMGGKDLITSLYYFSKQFEDRAKISTYFHDYTQNREEIDYSPIYINDYLGKVTEQFDGAITLMTTVLYVFVGISVFISAILNAILTYISIHQRTNEIGLLRSMGARKVDIGIMIETEAFITGIFGGLLSILLAVILVRPMNSLITNAIYQYKFYLLSSTTFNLGGFKWWIAPLLIGVGIVTSLISALIPAIVASRKKPARAINE